MSDGVDIVRQCDGLKKKELVAEIQETHCGPDPEVPPIILGQSILKGEKMSSVVQKATELGVSSIVPLLSERVIPRLSSAPAQAPSGTMAKNSIGGRTTVRTVGGSYDWFSSTIREFL